LIGTGREFPAPSNVRFYKEMPFKATLPYIKHADFGIAAYRPSANSGYLAQSSLKLMQYEYLGSRLRRRREPESFWIFFEQSRHH
jgi:2-beta-glucuronyltransferase